MLKISVSNTALTNSGSERPISDPTEITRSTGRPSPDPRDDPQRDRQRHGHDEAERPENQGVAQPPQQLGRDVATQMHRIPEIALGCADQPGDEPDGRGLIEAQAAAQGFQRIGCDALAQGFLRRVARHELGDHEDRQRDDQQREHHQRQAARGEAQPTVQHSAAMMPAPP